MECTTVSSTRAYYLEIMMADPCSSTQRKTQGNILEISLNRNVY